MEYFDVKSNCLSGRNLPQLPLSLSKSEFDNSLSLLKKTEKKRKIKLGTKMYFLKIQET